MDEISTCRLFMIQSCADLYSTTVDILQPCDSWNHQLIYGMLWFLESPKFAENPINERLDIYFCLVSLIG